MSTPTPSDLDYTQTLQGAYDDSKGAFRVEAQITAPLDVNGEVLVDVRASDGDSVLVYGTTDGTTSGPQQVLKVNSDGSINTNIIASSVTIGTVNQGSPNTIGNAWPVEITNGTYVVAVNSDGSINTNGTSTVSGSVTVSGTVNTNLNGLSNFQTSQYTVGITAVQLTPTPLTGRSSISIKAMLTGVNIVFIGNSSSVTTSTGYPLYNGDSVQFDLTASQTIYAIATGANQTVCVAEVG